MILTVEGVYIKIGIKNDAFYSSTDIPKESVDLKLIIELTLATIDYEAKAEEEDIEQAR